MSKKIDNKLTTAQVGEKVTVKGTGIHAKDLEYTVLPACEQKGTGHWYCVTHREHFTNNFMKDTHISDGRTHKLAWLCHEHGVEVP